MSIDMLVLYMWQPRPLNVRTRSRLSDANGLCAANRNDLPFVSAMSEDAGGDQIALNATLFHLYENSANWPLVHSSLDITTQGGQAVTHNDVSLSLLISIYACELFDLSSFLSPCSPF